MYQQKDYKQLLEKQSIPSGGGQQLQGANAQISPEIQKIYERYGDTNMASPQSNQFNQQQQNYQQFQSPKPFQQQQQQQQATPPQYEQQYQKQQQPQQQQQQQQKQPEKQIFQPPQQPVVQDYKKPQEKQGGDKKFTNYVSPLNQNETITIKKQKPTTEDGVKKPASEHQQTDDYAKLTEQDKQKYADLGKQFYFGAMDKSSKNAEKSKWLVKVSELKNRNQKYEDEDFSASINSLVGESFQERFQWKAFQWLRPQEFFPSNTPIKVFEGKIEPNDIVQGALGNCYFLSTLASLAEWPDRIKKVFQISLGYETLPDEEVFALSQKYGCYFVNMLVQGELKEILIDDKIPCISKQKGPAFTKSNGNELWVILLEKAWAKIYGSYDNIEGGLTRECLHDLTGAPTKTLWCSDQGEEVWQNIYRGEQENYAMTAGTPVFDEGQDELSSFGLVGGHAYTLMAGFEIQFRGSTCRLVKLRNPWGDKEWTGNFSDKSRLWDEVDEGTKRRIGLTKGVDDGIFFMEFEEFRQYYENCQFCLIHDNFKYQSLRVASKKNEGKFFQIDIRQRGKYFFSINQQSKRMYPKEKQDQFKYSQVTMVFSKYNPNSNNNYDKYQIVEGIQKADREVFTCKGEEGDDNQLEPGTYIMFIKVDWRYKPENEYVLSSYGIENVDIKPITTNKEFLGCTYLNHAMFVSAKKKNFASNQLPDLWQCVDCTDDGYAYLSAWNKGQKAINLEFKIKQMCEGMHLKKPFGKTQAQIKFVLKPNDSQIALIRVTKSYQLNYSLMMSFAK